MLRFEAEGRDEPLLQRLCQAVDDDDPLAQLKIALALFQQTLGGDEDMVFTWIDHTDLVEFPALHERLLRSWVVTSRGAALANAGRYSEAMETDRTSMVFVRAAERGYLPAQIGAARARRSDHESFGMALELLPHVHRGCKELDYVFGIALWQGSRRGMPVFYWGMKCALNSGLLEPRFPEPGQTFGALVRECSNDYGRVVEDNGVSFIGSRILAPSPAIWDTFVGTKLSPARPCQLRFTYDSRALTRTIKEHARGLTSAGFMNCIEHAPGELTELAPVAKFVHDITNRGGTADSACRWLDQLWC